MRTSGVVFLILSVSLVAVAQCPYSQPGFNKAQIAQLCSVWTQQQTEFNSLKSEASSAQSDIKALKSEFQIEMITVKPGQPHAVGNIWALFIPSGAMLPGTGGYVLLPQFPSSTQTVGFTLNGGSTCQITLRNDQPPPSQAYHILNSCQQPVTVVVLYAGHPIKPVD